MWANRSPTLNLSRLILEKPSITPKDYGCQLIIEERLQKLGFKTKQFPKGDVQNLWAKLGTSKPVFCFAGHTDVVPPGDLSLWKNDPFTPTIYDDGYLIARGAADMKTSIAAMITAVERFLSSNPSFPGSIAFLITSDEEGPAIDGTQYALDELSKIGEIPDFCLVGEASSFQKLADTIRIGRRGSLNGTLTLHGKQGHVAYPDLARNPIHLAFEPLQKIISHVWDQGQPPFPPTSLQFSNINSGTGAKNVIPGSLVAEFNFRFSPASKPEELQRLVEEMLKESNCLFDLSWVLGAKPFYTSPENKFIEKVSSVILKEKGYSPELSTGGGTSDGRFFAEHGCPVVELGPINASIHQINERVLVEELDSLSDLYEKILISLFRT